ncbi:MAG TPA: outer membrane beta-barrel protein [Gemmatimonadaceae bacterium]|nr:outer membrane beta-barrel protein [Gemmatimonadaceae bacterium]
MKRIALTIVALAAIAAAASTSSAQSTKPVSLGISAGAAIPVSDLGNDYSTGWNGTVSLGFNSYGSPLGFRVDGMYNSMSAQDGVNLPDIKISSANANLVYALPGTGIRPYLIGGAGVYGLKRDFAGASTNTKLGLNGGVGASFPLSGFNTFVEARLHHVFSDNVATQFIPVTFGISF